MAHKKSFCIGGLLLAAVGVPESRGDVFNPMPDQSWVPNVPWQERCVGYNQDITAAQRSGDFLLGWGRADM